MSQRMSDGDYESAVKAMVDTMDKPTVEAWIANLRKRHAELKNFVDEFYKVDRYLYILAKLTKTPVPDVFGFDDVPATMPVETPEPVKTPEPVAVAAHAKKASHHTTQENARKAPTGDPAMLSKYTTLMAPRRSDDVQLKMTRVYNAASDRMLSLLQADVMDFFVDNAARYTATQFATVTGQSTKSSANVLNRMARAGLLKSSGVPRVYSTAITVNRPVAAAPAKNEEKPVEDSSTNTSTNKQGISALSSRVGGKKPDSEFVPVKFTPAPEFAEMLSRYPSLQYSRQQGGMTEATAKRYFAPLDKYMTELGIAVYNFLTELGRPINAGEFGRITGIPMTTINSLFYRLVTAGILNHNNTSPFMFTPAPPVQPTEKVQPAVSMVEPVTAPGAVTEPEDEALEVETAKPHAMSTEEIESKVKIYLKKFSGGHTATEMANLLARYGATYAGVNAVMRNMYVKGEICREEGGRGKFFLPGQGGRPFRAIPRPTAVAEANTAGSHPLPVQPSGTPDAKHDREPAESKPASQIPVSPIVKAPAPANIVKPARGGEPTITLRSGLTVSAKSGLSDDEINALIAFVPANEPPKPVVLKQLDALLRDNNDLQNPK